MVSQAHNKCKSGLDPIDCKSSFLFSSKYARVQLREKQKTSKCGYHNFWLWQAYTQWHAMTGRWLLSMLVPRSYQRVVTSQFTCTSCNLCSVIYFWLHQELKESLCLSVCLSERYKSLSLSGLSQDSLRVWFSSLLGLFQVWCVSGLFRLSLYAFLAYFIWQTEPKILWLVKRNCASAFCIWESESCKM